MLKIQAKIHRWKIFTGRIFPSANVTLELIYAYLLLFCSSTGGEEMAVSRAFTIHEIFQRIYIMY